MAVSKRLRFEILRRDNHACRYCGGMAPDVILTIDHVVPVALGGSDDPANLVAACKDCNAGKSSVPGDAAIVDDVSQDAIRWAAALREAFAQKLDEMAARDDYVAEFRSAWDGWKFPDGSTTSLPSDWERTVEKWYGMGLPLAILTSAVRGAMSKRGLRGFDAEFRYMCGIVWSTLTEIQQQTAASLAPPEPKPVAHCEPDGCDVHGDPAEPCGTCGRLNCLWACGYAKGEFEGWMRLYNQHEFDILQGTILSAVCDRGGYKPPAF